MDPHVRNPYLSNPSAFYYQPLPQEPTFIEAIPIQELSIPQQATTVASSNLLHKYIPLTLLGVTATIGGITLTVLGRNSATLLIYGLFLGVIGIAAAFTGADNIIKGVRKKPAEVEVEQPGVMPNYPVPLLT